MSQRVFSSLVVKDLEKVSDSDQNVKSLPYSIILLKNLLHVIFDC